MDTRIQEALTANQTIEITTTGRTSGKPHRVETALIVVDGMLYLSGFPGKRDWYANLLAHPAFTLHLKERVVADVPAVATPISDAKARRRIIGTIVTRWHRTDELESWVAGSPLMALSVDGANESA